MAINFSALMPARSDRLLDPRPKVMGILNVTPDSFSDGGAFLEPQTAVRRVLEMVAEGAELIDLGAESTRPGSRSVDPEEQLNRLLPVLDALQQSGSFPDTVALSVDTSSHIVAEEALKRGCSMINDVTAGRSDPAIFDVVAKYKAMMVLMHMQGTPDTMQTAPHYVDVVSEVLESLLSRVDCALASGVERDRLVLDPGIGFGKSRAHNLELIQQIDRVVALGYPVLLGCSRKRFMGALCGEAEPRELLGATVATTVYGYARGVRLFRVHDIRPNRQALDVVVALDTVDEARLFEQESGHLSAEFGFSHPHKSGAD